MAPFNSKSFPDSLAIAKEGSLTIGSIDEVQKLHIRTVPLGEQPRRVAHLESARAFLVVTSPHIFSTGELCHFPVQQRRMRNAVSFCAPLSQARKAAVFAAERQAVEEAVCRPGCTTKTA